MEYDGLQQIDPSQEAVLLVDDVRIHGAIAAEEDRVKQGAHMVYLEVEGSVVSSGGLRVKYRLMMEPALAAHIVAGCSLAIRDELVTLAKMQRFMSDEGDNDDG
jgi:hypothetical protein